MDDVLARLAAMVPHSAYDYLAFLIVYVVLTAITVVVLRVVLPSRPDPRRKGMWTDAAIVDYLDRGQRPAWGAARPHRERRHLPAHPGRRSARTGRAGRRGAALHGVGRSS